MLLQLLVGIGQVGSGLSNEPTFARQVLSQKFYCEGANFADLDRDGHSDVISGPFWYRGPEFKEARELYEPKEYDPSHYSDNFFSFPYDFNGDAWLDVLVVGFPGESASWFENPKTETKRWDKHLIAEHVDNESPTFGDLTGDTKPELIFHVGGRLGWAEPDWAKPNEPWTFHPLSEDLALERFTHGLGIGDVDGDGRADVLLASGWWQQPTALAGDPPWQRHDFPFTDQYGGAQMHVYDVDGDGRNDVVTSLAAHHFGLSWFGQVKKDGEISFVEHEILSPRKEEVVDGVQFGELHALDLIDVDGDGLKDIVTGKRWWSHGAEGDPDGPGSRAVVYWFGLTRSPGGEVKFVPHLIDDGSGVGVQVVAGDVNGDGKPDVVVGNKKGTFVLLQQAVKPLLSEPQKIAALLEAIEQSGATFVRNGTEYESTKAVEHLRSKLEMAGDRIKTARDFIEGVASKSETSGKPYEMILPDRTRMNTREWLSKRLAELEGPAARPASTK